VVLPTTCEIDAERVAYIVNALLAHEGHGEDVPLTVELGDGLHC
jgi:hypothetical protein